MFLAPSLIRLRACPFDRHPTARPLAYGARPAPRIAPYLEGAHRPGRPHDGQDHHGPPPFQRRSA
eukprot:5362277-Prymnesium_polylepis.1